MKIHCKSTLYDVVWIIMLLIHLWEFKLIWKVSLGSIEICYSYTHQVNYSPQNENLNLLVRIKFLHLFLYSSKWKLKNLLVRTKFYWSWAGGTVLIVRTGIRVPEISKKNMAWECNIHGVFEPDSVIFRLTQRF